ncbi:MAG: hypothetical protein ACK5H0_10430 [Bacteroidota bacterium]|jgi:hypothetical protein
MSAANYDLSISCGEDFNFTLRVLDAFDDPINFVGSTYIAEIREEHKKPLIAAFAVTSLGDGTLKFDLTDTQTKALSPTRKYKWDFFWTQSGVTTKLLYGSVTAISNISNV